MSSGQYKVDPIKVLWLKSEEIDHFDRPFGNAKWSVSFDKCISLFNLFKNFTNIYFNSSISVAQGDPKPK